MRFSVAVVVLMLWGALGGCEGAPTSPMPPRAVRTLTIASRDLSTSSRFTGSLAPWTQVDLAFSVGGRVGTLATADASRRPIQEGDRVTRGQTLATLDSGDFTLKTRAASASLGGAGAQLRAAETALAQATVDAERARKLAASGAIPAADLERSEARLASARSSVDVARAQRQTASEQLALAQSVVGDTVLVSPIDGVVARRLIDVGENVGPGMLAFSIIETARLRVVIGVPSHQVGSMTIGRKIPVRVEGHPATLVGSVSKVLPMADPLLRSFSVELTIPNPDDSLRPGMVASAGIADERGPVILVPLAAIIRDRGPAGGFAVWTVSAGKVSARHVELGDLEGNSVIVTRGLSPGDTVVVDGAQLVRDGETVQVQP